VRLLSGMVEITKQITAEIEKIQAGIDAQKRVIKHNADNKGVVVQEAEQQLKALRTRLRVLETNLKKCAPEPEAN
jgi:uncharacterized protein involved in exopolysaccharide biosynthesis